MNRIIYVAGSGTSRAPMAAAATVLLMEDSSIEVLARGVVVQFPEPMNQKAEAILISNGVDTAGYQAKQLLDEEVTDETLVFVMEEKTRQQLIANYPHITEDNCKVLSAFVGDELEILDPYGANIQHYGICFELIKSSVDRALDLLGIAKKGERA